MLDTRPLFDNPFLVLFDLEFTSWERGVGSGWRQPGRRREIVQIGAVRLDCIADLAELNGFSALVKPVFDPCLSSYFSDLTGITQESVDRHGVSFSQALASFQAFIGDAPVTLACHGLDGEIVLENCGWHGIEGPSLFGECYNLRPLIEDVSGVSASASELPDCFGLDTVEAAHDALGDARALAVVLRYLIAEGRIAGPVTKGVNAGQDDKD